MQLSIALVLLGVAAVCAFPTDMDAAPAAPAADAGGHSGGCPGGYAEGAEIERGRLVYVCQGSAVVPKGCIAEDLSRIAVGGHYDNAHYRRTCNSAGDSLTFEPTGCVANGQEHKASESFEDGNNFYTCVASTTEPLLKAVNQGCVEGGKRVPKKEKVQKDDGVYVCEESANGGSKLIQGGCVKDGKAYNNGDAVEAGKEWFNCSRIGREKYTLKAAGCVQGGKRLNDGDRYFDKDIIFECRVEGGKTDVLAMGCVQTEGGSTVERRLGCTWVEGTAPNQVEVGCQKDDAAGAKKVQIRCNYNVGSGVYNIDPGCFRQGDKDFVGCSSAGGNLQTVTFPTADAASGSGLHAC